MDINICEDVLKLPNFEDIPHSVLKALVQMDNLKCSEHVLFKSCLRWARSEAVRRGPDPHHPVTLREILGDVIPHIRFLAMDKEEFATNVVESNLFTSDEKEPILIFHITGKLKNLSPLFCTQTAVRGKVEHEEFEVLVRPGLTDGRHNSKIKLGDSFHKNTSSVLSRGGVTFSSDADLLGVQVPTQVKNVVSPGDSNTTYEENLTLIVRNYLTSKIIAIAPFKSIVNYNSIIDVPLETPLRCSEELGNDSVTCSVIFHQSGKYPAVRDTTEKKIVEVDQHFHGESGVRFFYVSSFKYINCIAYKFV